MVERISPIPTSVPNTIEGLQAYLRDMAGKVNTYFEQIANSDPFFVKDTGCLSPPANEVEANALEIVFVSPFSGAGTLIITGVGFTSGNLNVSVNGVNLGTISNPSPTDEILYEIPVDDMIQGFNSLKLWSTDSDTGEVRRVEAWRNFLKDQVTSAGTTAIWDSITGTGKPADNAQVNGPSLALLINEEFDGTSNPGEFSLIGYDDDGNAALSTDGYFWLADTKTTVDRTGGITGALFTGATSQGNRAGFIVYDLGGTTFTRSGTAEKPLVVFVWRFGNTWYYDDNAASQTFTPTANHVALGWLETGGADDITRGALFTPAPLLSAAFPGATDGAVFGVNFFRADNLTLLNETDFASNFNKIAEANIGNFFDAAAITTAYIKDAQISTAKIADAAITNVKIGTASIDASKIQSAVITDALIASATITGAKIAAATITDANIASATITAASIANATITGAKIASATITNANIANLDAAKITTGTLSADRIGAGTITASKFVTDSGVDLAAIVPGSLNNKFYTLDTTSVILVNSGTLVGNSGTTSTSTSIDQINQYLKANVDIKLVSGTKQSLIVKLQKQVGGGSWQDVDSRTITAAQYTTSFLTFDILQGQQPLEVNTDDVRLRIYCQLTGPPSYTVEFDNFEMEFTAIYIK